MSSAEWNSRVALRASVPTKSRIGDGPLTPKQAIALVAGTPGGKFWAKEHPDDYAFFLDLLSDRTPADGGSAREQVAQFILELEREAKWGLEPRNPVNQYIILVGILLQPVLSFEASLGERQWVPGPKPQLIAHGLDICFKGYARARKADAYAVNINGQAITVILPSEPAVAGAYRYSLEQVSNALANMPEPARAQVREVHMAPARPSGNSKLGSVLASYDGIADVMTVYPTSNSQSLTLLTLVDDLVHEAGHAWSNRAWGNESSAEWTSWGRAGISDGKWASQYARFRQDDDAAETLFRYWGTLGTPEHEEWRKLLPGRFAILDRAFNRQGWGGKGQS
jgi:hypothetical protein